MDYTQPIEKHPLGFFLPENARILMLGSFPPKKEKWSMNFYYPNFQNDMWRIMGIIFYQDKNYFLAESMKGFNEEKTKRFCLEKRIAIGDTASEVIRMNDNASDKFLQVITPFNPSEILPKIPQCEAIAITGQKAMDTLISVMPFSEPKVGSFSDCSFMGRRLKIYRMPSSSRAYPKSLQGKADDYQRMFEELGFNRKILQ